MPKPQPNSLRLDRSRGEPGVDRAKPSVTLVGSRDPDVVLPGDTTLGKLQALSAKLAARSARSQGSSPELVRSRTSTAEITDRIRKVVEKSRLNHGSSDKSERDAALSDRPRQTAEKIDAPTQPVDLSRAHEIIRTAEERAREKRERDRARDRDGPGR